MIRNHPRVPKTSVGADKSAVGCDKSALRWVDDLFSVASFLTLTPIGTLGRFYNFFTVY